MKKHAKLSASGSARWLNCPGSVKAEENYPDETSSFAIEGTFAHELADMCLSKGLDAKHYLGKEISIIEKLNGAKSKLFNTVDHEMVSNVQQYLDYVRSFEKAHTVLYCEDRVNFSNIVPGGFGTLDAAVYDPKTKHLDIFDLKYGKGELVEAEKNTQGMLYAVGMVNDYKGIEVFERITIHIVQPRIDNYSFWSFDAEYLNKFSKWVAQRAKLALSPDAPRKAGNKQCRWCKAKADCKQLRDFTTHIIKSDFDGIGKKDFNMNDDDKKKVLDNADMISQFLDAVKKSVFDQLLKGDTFPGYKLVEGRSNRKLTEQGEKFLIRAFKEKAFNKKIIGVGDAEKLIGKQRLQKYVIKPKGKPVVVPLDDKRPPFYEAMQIEVKKDFENI